MKLPIEKLSLVRSVLIILSHGRLWGPSLKIVATVWRKFFWFQYKAALHLIKIPIVNVEAPLDAEIPFRPEFVATYLDFTHLWIQCGAYALKEAAPLESVIQFFRRIREIYLKAFEIYSQCLSTTKRPNYNKKPQFVLIHLTDPHFMCIPSLHVMLVAGASLLSKTLFSGTDYVRRRALEISASVLYVKQHSVNCVAAALYALSCYDKDEFTPEWVQQFISEIPIEEENKAKVLEFIRNKYDEFMTENKTADWRKPLLDFLLKR
jgi:hypothetical protein